MAKRKTSPRTWEDMVDLDKAMVSLEWKRSKTKADIEISESELKQFLDDECN